MFESPAEADALAIPVGHEILVEWAAEAAAGDIVLAGGFCERGDDGRIYNSAAVFDATGLRAVYRKLHLWDREKLVFTPGAEPPPVLDTRVGRLAVIICYDHRVPRADASRSRWPAPSCCWCPTNWPLVPRPHG